MHTVSVIRCNSYNPQDIKNVLEQSLKNINFKFRKGMKVLIKPNLLSPNKPESAITTHPVVIEEICKILKKYGSKIYIGDSGAYETDRALQLSGMNALVKYAKIINFEGEEKKFFNFGKHASRIPLAKIATDADLVINVPKMKTHGLTQVTLCIKNLYGCVPGQIKEKLHRILIAPDQFCRLLVKIEETIRPELNIIDGVTAMEGEGPGAAGKVIKPGLIIASKSAPAADIIASEIMGFAPNAIYTNKFSRVKRKEITVMGDAKIRLSFQKPVSSNIPSLMYLARFLPKPKIRFSEEKCKQCHICEKKCPVKAIKLNPFPKCSHGKCIKCLCCIEVCPHKAVYLEEPLLRKILKAIGKKLVRF